MTTCRHLPSRLMFLSLTILAIALVCSPANAHHPSGGVTPDSFGHGLLSGLAHPIIGLDHLAFVIAIGLLASFQRKRDNRSVHAFLLTTMVGAVLTAGGISFAFTELGIALSIAILGLALFRDWDGEAAKPIMFAALSGLFHGLAYGETIIGAQTAPILAYLLGFIVTQSIIVFAVRFAAHALIHRHSDSDQRKRFAALSASVFTAIGAIFVLFALGS